jgi:hypothetical protein
MRRIPALLAALRWKARCNDPAAHTAPALPTLRQKTWSAVISPLAILRMPGI